MDDYLIGRLEGGETIAVATADPFFCVAEPDERAARATATRARLFWERSDRLRPAPAARPVKPDFTRVRRQED